MTMVSRQHLVSFAKPSTRLIGMEWPVNLSLPYIPVGLISHRLAL